MVARGIWQGLLAAALLAGTAVADGADAANAAHPVGAESTTPTPAPDSIETARQLVADGRYADAEAVARTLLGRAEVDWGADSPQAAEALVVLADALRRGGRPMDEETLAAARRAVSILEQPPTSSDARLADALVVLSSVLQNRSEYAEARVSLDRALDIYGSVPTPDESDLATVHQNLGALCAAIADWDAAEGHYRAALEVYERTSGPDSDDAAQALFGLGTVLINRGRYAEAEILYRRTLAIWERERGPRDPVVANVWNNLGYLHTETGEYELARSELERALAIREEALPAGHPLTIMTLGNLAILYSNLGLDSDAVYRRAIAAADATFGRDSELSAGLRANYANDRRTADWAEARRLFEEALAIFERIYGPDHPRVAWMLGQLGLHALDTGDLDGAARNLERAVRLDDEHPEAMQRLHASHMASLARCRAEAGRIDEARNLLERSVAIAEETLGPNSSQTRDSLKELGQLLRRTGDLEGARAALTSAAAPDPANPRGTRREPDRLVALAELELETGHPDAARPLFERALEISAERIGNDSPEHAATMLRYGAFLLTVGEPGRALDVALEAGSTTRRHLRSTVATLPERQALGLASWVPLGVDLAVSSARARGPSAAATAFDIVVRSRALVLDEVAERHHIARLAHDPGVERLLDAYVAASARLANLTVGGLDERFPERSAERLRAARDDKERAEHALAERSAAVRAVGERDKAGLREVAAALPAGSALVSFVRHAEVAAGSPTAGPAGRADSYAAFVLRAGGATPTLVDLGDAAQIDQLVDGVRTKVRQAASSPLGAGRQGEAAYRRAAEALRQRAWDPLEAHLQGTGTVFLVPDGALNLVSFAALPAADGGYLVERGPRLHLLSAERDLLASPDHAGTGLLVIGDPAFDEGRLFAALRGPDAPNLGGPVKLASAEVYRGQRSACGDLRSLRFEPLPSTGTEVREVVAAWEDAAPRLRGAGPVATPEVLGGAGASELAVKLGAPGKDVLHLATHGFFLGEGCPSALDARRTVTGAPTTGAVRGDSPLLLAGLALAGANRRDAAGADEDDGILTAEEIAALDLSGVRWAVLSACDTGLGEIRAGEGVLGLRRAFQVAGARTVIMSLWPVEDEAGRHWMGSLYAHRLVQGMTTVEAVHAATLGELERRRAEGLSTHPFYWAGFVAAGDWR